LEFETEAFAVSQRICDMLKNCCGAVSEFLHKLDKLPDNRNVLVSVCGVGG
jgi:hypothetical protein